MLIDIVTLFPEMFKGPFEESIIKRAKEKKIVKINIHNLRKWAIDKRGTVDDRPYGGGVGMILRPEPIFNAVADLLKEVGPALAEGKGGSDLKTKVILLDAAGKPHNQKKARNFSKKDHLILICGHYEGVDYRVHQYLVDEVISIGDYVLTGGEIPAMVIVDSVVRLIPGVLEKEEATQFESFSPNYPITKLLNYPPKAKLLEFPQYTRPEKFRGHKVPTVLLSGNHQEIAKWRLKQAVARTRKFRPDILKNTNTSKVF